MCGWGPSKKVLPLACDLWLSTQSIFANIRTAFLEDIKRMFTFSPLPPFRPRIPSAPWRKPQIKLDQNLEDVFVSFVQSVMSTHLDATRSRVADGSHWSGETLRTRKKCYLFEFIWYISIDFPEVCNKLHMWKRLTRIWTQLYTVKKSGEMLSYLGHAKCVP